VVHTLYLICFQNQALYATNVTSVTATGCTRACRHSATSSQPSENLKESCFWTLPIAYVSLKSTFWKQGLFLSSGKQMAVPPLLGPSIPRPVVQIQFPKHCDFYKNIRQWTKSKNVILSSAIYHCQNHLELTQKTCCTNHTHLHMIRSLPYILHLSCSCFSQFHFLFHWKYDTVLFYIQSDSLMPFCTASNVKMQGV
jgi:hypothetical protein